MRNPPGLRCVSASAAKITQASQKQKTEIRATVSSLSSRSPPSSPQLPDTMPEPEKPYPKKRRSAPKVRTGCGTCRVRRVKCDEARPSCQRCQKFGAACAGYRPPPTPWAPPRDILRRTSVVLASDPLATSPFADVEEYLYFDRFCARTGYDIFPAFDSGCTRQRLLESCHSNPAIRHAIVALGALDRTAEMVQSFEKLSLAPVERGAAATRHHQNALRQYARAVRYMAADARETRVDLRTMLLTCLLVLAFESWTGNMDLAVSQVHAGIRLIQAWKENFKNDADRSTRLSPAPYVVEDDLIQIFCRLAVQHSFFADGHSGELHALLGMEGPRFTRSMPDTFDDIFEAGKYYDGIIRRGVYLITTRSAYLGPDVREDSEIWRWAIREQEEIQADVWRFNQALAPVLRHVADGPQSHYALFIQLSMAIGYIGLSTHLAEETIHDQYNAVYARVVSLATAVMKAMPSQGRPSHFCFDTRVIVPLWVVGLKCREPSIRRGAIDFLLANPRREGIWDSVFAGNVLRWAMDVEEEFLADGHVPGWARIAGVKWSGAELGGKRADLLCLQRVSAREATTRRRTTTITW
ncbi:hypothetical protein QTJ16_006617 [Diplocarpon rosae]|uniref:Zn(2)-C6 fungal-type domain-containing protein n=1 Tax=Diplocarpon rosae TaxID=946125 RepID=A0AAD9SVM4_9HELO|nr:hypothetical protein QTJ16_006617 [Diplocarpon rosae]